MADYDILCRTLALREALRQAHLDAHEHGEKTLSAALHRAYSELLGTAVHGAEGGVEVDEVCVDNESAVELIAEVDSDEPDEEEDEDAVRK